MPQHPVPFNRPLITGSELSFIRESIETGILSGDGLFSSRCKAFFVSRYGFKNTMLTTSCTDALEMAAMLIGICPGDEIITCSYTYVSTANAFVLRGANVVFADCRNDYPGIDEDSLERLITKNTKAIIPVHYAGIACDMDKIMAVADKYNLYVIEDAAQCIDAYYTGADGMQKPLGSIGHLSAFSFHETKNITCGEGGMLVINDERLLDRAEILLEKGTNRRRFLRHEIDKYQWVDVGSSFSPSDVTAAFLYAQLQHLDSVQQARIKTWETYYSTLLPLQKRGHLTLPHIPHYASNNGHIFYIVCPSPEIRNNLMKHLKMMGISASFHYVSLHSSEFYKAYNKNIPYLPQSDKFSECLLRLPMYYGITDNEIKSVTDAICTFFEANA